MTLRPIAALALSGALLGACGSCDRRGDAADAAPAPSGSTRAVVAETLPRCRAEGPRLALPGDDVVVGDVAVGPAGILVGLVRVREGKRTASILRAPLDLGSSSVVDLGTAFGDDPPPSPRWNGTTPWAASLSRIADAGTKVRALVLSRLPEAGDGASKVEATLEQQADESTAFDLAWNDGGGLLAAWDEDAPPGASDAGATARGFVKVQLLGGKVRVASPETSDAESPRLLARPGGGFWLAWLAQKTEEEAYAVEGPGEKRAFRWVEVVPLDARGEAAGPVRRVSSEKGRATAFELARSGADLVVIVQDEAAQAEGGGARMVRHLVGESIESNDLVDGGVGHSLADLVPTSELSGRDAPATDAGGGAALRRWLAWSDVAERAHLTPLGATLLPAAPATPEPALDGTRVLASAPPDVVFVLGGAELATRPELEKGGDTRPEVPPDPRPALRRFVCR